MTQECGVTSRKYTYAQARDHSNYVARSLLTMGLKTGDVVALVLPNLPETAIAFLGCLEAGVIVTTVNPIYTAGECTSTGDTPRYRPNTAHIYFCHDELEKILPYQ